MERQRFIQEINLLPKDIAVCTSNFAITYMENKGDITKTIDSVYTDMDISHPRPGSLSDSLDTWRLNVPVMSMRASGLGAAIMYLELPEEITSKKLGKENIRFLDNFFEKGRDIFTEAQEITNTAWPNEARTLGNSIDWIEKLEINYHTSMELWELQKDYLLGGFLIGATFALRDYRERTVGMIGGIDALDQIDPI